MLAYNESSPSPDFITGERMREPDSGPTRRRTGSNNSGTGGKGGHGLGLGLGLGIGGRMRSVSQHVNRGWKEAQRAMTFSTRSTNAGLSASPTSSSSLSRSNVNVKTEERETDMRTVRARSGSGSGYHNNLRMGAQEGGIGGDATVRRKKRSTSSSSAALNDDVSPLIPAALLPLPSSRASSAEKENSPDPHHTQRGKQRTLSNSGGPPGVVREQAPQRSELRPPKLAPSAWQLFFTDWINRRM